MSDGIRHMSLVKSRWINTYIKIKTITNKSFLT